MTTAVGATCGFCFVAIEEEEPRSCESCGAPYHADCWDENGGCGAYGCEKAPAVEPRGAAEIPAGRWGTEHRPCSGCGADILAEAIRCRHCGKTFREDELIEGKEGEELRRRRKVEPRLRKIATVLLLAALLPPIAPAVLIVTAIFRARSAEDLRKGPPMARVLAGLALVASAAGTVVDALVVAAMAFRQFFG